MSKKRKRISRRRLMPVQRVLAPHSTHNLETVKHKPVTARPSVHRRIRPAAPALPECGAANETNHGIVFFFWGEKGPVQRPIR